MIFIISLIPLWTFASFTGFPGFTTNATCLCKEQFIWSNVSVSLHCSSLFDKLLEDVIGCGGHCAIFVDHQLQEDYPLIVPWDPTKEVERVLLLAHLGDFLGRVHHSSISVNSR